MADRTEYLNRTQGWLGVIKINRKGDELATAVEPGARVFLTDEEVELTAASHRSPGDSPFEVRHIIHRDGAGDVIDSFDAPPLQRRDEYEREQKAAKQPERPTPVRNQRRHP